MLREIVATSPTDCINHIIYIDSRRGIAYHRSCERFQGCLDAISDATTGPDFLYGHNSSSAGCGHLAKPAIIQRNKPRKLCEPSGTGVLRRAGRSQDAACIRAYEVLPGVSHRYSIRWSLHSNVGTECYGTLLVLSNRLLLASLLRVYAGCTAFSLPLFS